jgi:hypothetical protein
LFRDLIVSEPWTPRALVWPLAFGLFYTQLAFVVLMSVIRTIARKVLRVDLVMHTILVHPSR